MNHTHDTTIISSFLSWGSEVADFVNHHWLTVSVFSGVIVFLLAIILFQCCCRNKKSIINIDRNKV